MKKRRPPQDLVLSDAEVRDVIDRAVRTQTRPNGVTIAELRQIAAELDIDPNAFEQALDQVVGMPIPGKPIRSWLKRQMTKLGRLTDAFLPQTGRLIGFGMFGAIAGWLNAYLMDFSINAHYATAAAMIGLTAANLLSRRLDQKLARFITETLAQWVLYGAAWSVTYGGVTDNLVIWVVFWTSQASMLGYILMRDATGTPRGTPISDSTTEQSASMQSDDDTARMRVRIKYPLLLWSTLLRPVRGSLSQI
jgi:hypothetical protein